MNKKVIKTFGFVSLIIGFLLVLTSFRLTGFAVLGSFKQAAIPVIGFLFVIGGVVLVVLGREGKESPLERKTAKELGKIKQEIKSGRIGSYNDLIRHARNLGYEIREDKRHMGVYRDTRRVTEIPRGKKGESTGTYRKILRELYDSIA